VDPVSLIVTALAAGAAAGLKPTAEAAVRDAYAGLKAFIRSRYAHVDLAPLEQKPASEAKRASLAEDLEEGGAADDGELFELARSLVEVLRSHDVDAAPVGVDLEDVNAQFLTVEKVFSAGTGVRVRGGKFTGGIDVGEVHAGQEDARRENPS
jgi:hypothetical protein